MTRQKITLYACIVLAMYVFLLGKSFGQHEGWLIDDKGRTSVADYISLHAAGKLALEGKPAAAYDRAQHRAAQDATVGRDSDANFPYAYPPTYFPIAATFAAMPYSAALIVFPLLTLILFSVVNAGIFGRWDGAVWMLATPPILWNICAAQNGFLNAAVLGSALLLLPTRPLLAGVFIGVLSYKPHLGLLLPFALAAAGYWRAFGTAAVTAVATVLLSVVMFGTAPWYAFAGAISEFGSFVLSDKYGNVWRLQSLFGALRTLGLDASLAIKAQYAWGIAMVAVIYLLWRRDVAYDLKAAALATATVMTSPYLFVYDLPLLTIAHAFLIRHMLDRGFALREVLILVLAHLGIYGYMSIHFPVGFVAALLTAAVIAGRIWEPARSGITPPIRDTGHPQLGS